MLSTSTTTNWQCTIPRPRSCSCVWLVDLFVVWLTRFYFVLALTSQLRLISLVVVLLSQVTKTLADIRLDPQADMQSFALSGGMKRKLSVGIGSENDIFCSI